MTKPKYYKKINDNASFVDEIPPNEVVEEEDKNDKKEKRPFILLIILIFAIIFGNALGYYLYELNYTNHNQFEKGDLVVIHSDVDFGPTILDLSEYKNYNNANEYNFYIKNMNKFEINYNIKLIPISNNSSFASNISTNNIYYAVLKNNKRVSSKLLNKVYKDTIYVTSTKPNTTDYYKILVWEKKIQTGYFKYQISIEK